MTAVPAASLGADMVGLLDHGTVHTSPGGQYSFRVIGPCCRLLGRRFVPDLASRRCPSYAVELLQPGSRPTVTVLTLFPQRFTTEMQEWWYSRRPSSMDASNFAPNAV